MTCLLELIKRARAQEEGSSPHHTNSSSRNMIKNCLYGFGSALFWSCLFIIYTHSHAHSEVTNARFRFSVLRQAIIRMPINHATYLKLNAQFRRTTTLNGTQFQLPIVYFLTSKIHSIAWLESLFMPMKYLPCHVEFKECTDWTEENETEEDHPIQLKQRVKHTF